MHLTGITTNPEGRWVTQRARNLLMQRNDEEVQPRFLIRDRDGKFTREFDEVFLIVPPWLRVDEVVTAAQLDPPDVPASTDLCRRSFVASIDNARYA